MPKKIMSDIEEEQRWQEFVDDYDSKSHPSAMMPDGCYTCKVGKRWSEADNIKLIEMVQPCVTLEDMARELNRSFNGIAGRLQLMGIITLQHPGQYYNMFWSDRVKKSTLRYRYKSSKKICFDVESFMEENWERLGWQKSDKFFLPPIGVRGTPVKKGHFNPSWRKRTEPERAKERNEKMALQKEETRRRNSYARITSIRNRESHPIYKKDGTLDRRYIGQK